MKRRIRQVRIVEVGPRDGLQNVNSAFDTEFKIEMINKLGNSGLKYIESGSFVNPKAVPKMADTQEVFSKMKRKNDITYSALVPNMKGLENAIASDVQEIAIFCSASETFSQKNIRCSIEQSIERFKEVIKEALKNKIRVRGYISCVLGCPYEGKIVLGNVKELNNKLLELGCYEISLGDTVGYGTPDKVKQLLDKIFSVHFDEKIGLHFHNTRGMAIANLLTGLDYPITSIDSSIAGLGGCPYAKGATGNVATEDVIYFLENLGIHTGVNLKQVIEIGEWASEKLKRRNESFVGRSKDTLFS